MSLLCMARMEIYIVYMNKTLNLTTSKQDATVWQYAVYRSDLKDFVKK